MDRLTGPGRPWYTRKPGDRPSGRRLSDMPRIRLTEREAYELHHALQVRPQDINYSGHVGNDNLIAMVGAARAFAFHEMGVSELDLGDGETGVIMTDLAVNYRAEAFLFDELSIDTHFDEMGRSGFRMFHRVRREGKTVALLEAGFATFSYRRKRISPVPDRFLGLLGTLRGD
jgi:acyl-CoA thioesterase FadM